MLLPSFNIPKCIVVGLSMVEGLFSLLFYCENGINQYAVPITLRVVFGGESVFELDCLRCVLRYYLR